MRLHVGYVLGNEIEIVQRDGGWTWGHRAYGRDTDPRHETFNAAAEAAFYAILAAKSAYMAEGDALRGLIEEVEDLGFRESHSLDYARMLVGTTKVRHQNPVEAQQRLILRYLGIGRDAALLFIRRGRRMFNEGFPGAYALVALRPGAIPLSRRWEAFATSNGGSGAPIEYFDLPQQPTEQAVPTDVLRSPAPSSWRPFPGTAPEDRKILVRGRWRNGQGPEPETVVAQWGSPIADGASGRQWLTLFLTPLAGIDVGFDEWTEIPA